MGRTRSYSYLEVRFRPRSKWQKSSQGLGFQPDRKWQGADKWLQIAQNGSSGRGLSGELGIAESATGAHLPTANHGRDYNSL